MEKAAQLVRSPDAGSIIMYPIPANSHQNIRNPRTRSQLLGTSCDQALPVRKPL